MTDTPTQRPAGRVGKIPSEPVYPADILGDQELQRCSIEVKGAWLWTLLEMWRSNRDRIEGTLDDFAHDWRCTTAVARRTIDEIKTRKIADVTISNKGVTLLCRRLARRQKAREHGKRRVSEHRKRIGNEGVTPQKVPPSSSSSSSPSKVREKSAPTQSVTDREFERIWGGYPNKVGKAKAKAAYSRARKSGTTEEEISEGLARYIKYVHAQRKTGFDLAWRHGATWFTGAGWCDECECRTAGDDEAEKRKAVRQKQRSEKQSDADLATAVDDFCVLGQPQRSISERRWSTLYDDKWVEEARDIAQHRLDNATEEN